MCPPHTCRAALREPPTWSGLTRGGTDSSPNDFLVYPGDSVGQVNRLAAADGVPDPEDGLRLGIPELDHDDGLVVLGRRRDGAKGALVVWAVLH